MVLKYYLVVMKKVNAATTEDIIILREDLRVEFDKKFDAFDSKAQLYRDQILTGLDKVMKELVNIREEYTVGNFRLEKRVKDHEKRISKLETAS